MRILVVSRAWPSCEHSGVSLAAAEHVRFLVEGGHEVLIAGSHPAVLDEQLPVEGKYHIRSTGSGAIYSPSSVDRDTLVALLNTSGLQLIIVEAWQTALTDAAVDVASKLGIPVLMVSHGISVHPFSGGVAAWLRSAGWLFYRLVLLPRRIRALTAITALDVHAGSDRFFDRKLAERYAIPVRLVVNSPVNWVFKDTDFSRRRRQIIVVGYFSSIKNQRAALMLARDLPDGITMRFVGPRDGAYFSACQQFVRAHALGSRVIFSEDHECDLPNEIAESMLMLSTSVTEALPLSLLEAMASGTPFVATPVGAVPSLGAGILTDDHDIRLRAVLTLFNDKEQWRKQSEMGRHRFIQRYTRDSVKQSLLAAVDDLTLMPQEGAR